MSKLRKDDPVYYKKAMQDLIKSATENGLKITIGRSMCASYIYFKADNGECAGVAIAEENRVWVR